MTEVKVRITGRILLARTANGRILLVGTADKGTKNDRGKGRGRNRWKSRKRGLSNNKKDITCRNCKQNGHFRNRCLAPKTQKEVNVVADDSGEALICSVECSVESWCNSPKTGANKNLRNATKYGT